ncbi:helix-turn-helix domain-containing protein [Streptomyces sp. SCSIO ZS0520]|uniref:helix-turn-helix domain-containing protein n=1 Tax=Streptomyces sp. SCSIO ZS0520 TaxID=2892996 RepID=UPI0021D9C86E|nr:helix-turn-helix domain-containing protein [Streptomyces sp. SCSIO ZS0520]
MLDETTISCAHVPPADRFDFWNEVMRRTIAPLELVSAHRSDYWADQRILELGTVTAWPTKNRPTLYRRTARHIRQSDPEFVHIGLSVAGPLQVTQDDRQFLVPSGDLHIADSSRPHEVRVGTSGRLHIGSSVKVPRALLPLGRDQIDRACPRHVPGDQGYGALLRELLLQLAGSSHSYGSEDGPRLGMLVADLLSALLVQTLDDGARALTPESRRRTLLLRVKEFVRAHLHEADLTPRTIAAAHHISLRHLHRLFADEDLTLSAWIRRQRLDRARRDLTDPTLRKVPVQQLAARWQFHSPSDFSRAFRTTYGVPPTEYRARSGELEFEGQESGAQESGEPAFGEQESGGRGRDSHGPGTVTREAPRLSR